MRKLHSTSVAVALTTILGSGSLAHAATPESTASEADPGQLEEIVVTAQKRSQSIQEVPLSIMAMNADMMEKANVVNAQDLPRLVPNLRVDRFGQSAATVIRIRGVGAAGNSAIDPSVAPFIDGAYVARPGVILSSFLDVASVEVLRGPQGTLFGRNATAGAVQINTNAPSFNGVEGELAAEYGNRGSYLARGVVNAPVGANFALRFAGVADGHDGYYHNALDGRDWGDRKSAAGRISARWRVTDNADWVLRIDYAKLGGDGSAPSEVNSDTATAAQLSALTARLAAFGSTAPDFRDSTDGNVNNYLVGDLDDKQAGVTSDLNWNLASGYRVRWIASHREWKNSQFDGDVVLLPISLVSRHGSFKSNSSSQEIQFISPKSGLLGGHFDYVAGLYYFSEDYKIGEILDLGSDFCGFLAPATARPTCNALGKLTASNLAFDQNADSYAAYLDTNWAFTDAVKLTLGARYTDDDKKADFTQLVANPFAAALRAPETGTYKFSDSKFTYRAVLSWFVADDKMLFANYSTGYKSGGINSGGSGVALTGKRVFDSENVDDIELGLKSTWLGGKMTFNATAYRMDIKDFQDRSFINSSFIVTNAGSLRQQGLEFELRAAPAEGFLVNLALAYLDSKFTDFRNAPGLAACPAPPGSATCPNPQDNTGKRANYSPEWDATLGLEYGNQFANGMKWSARADVHYLSEMNTGGTELSDQALIGNSSIMDARLSLTSSDGTWSASVFGNNLTDKRYIYAQGGQTLGAALGVNVPATGATLYRGSITPPRIYGVGLRYRF